jgi:hypothetical protein
MDCEYVFFAEDLHISQVIFGVPCAKKPDFEIVHSGQDCHPHEMSLSEKRIGKTGRLIIILIFKTVLWAPFSDTYHMVPHNCTKTRQFLVSRRLHPCLSIKQPGYVAVGSAEWMGAAVCTSSGFGSIGCCQGVVAQCQDRRRWLAALLSQVRSRCPGSPSCSCRAGYSLRS